MLLRSSLYFFGQLVPAFAVAYLGAHLPAETFGLLLDALQQRFDTFLDAFLAVVGEVVELQVSFEILQVGGEGAPEAPVGGAQLGDVGAVDALSVFFAYRMVVQEG